MSQSKPRLRECAGCGRALIMNNLKCESCRAVDRECVTCGESFRGVRVKCPQCRIPVRTCLGCGRTFRSNTTCCASCRAVERECVTCGKQIRGSNRECQACRVAHHAPEEWSAMVRQYGHARRARQLAALVTGPIPSAVYSAIIKSGPCVYCGASATTVDHIRPLSRGGYEAPENLVPACQSCNYSKCDGLLTEWRPDRVAHGIAASPLVRAEYERQLSDPPRVIPLDGTEPTYVPGRRRTPAYDRVAAVLTANPSLGNAEVSERARASVSTVSRARRELAGRPIVKRARPTPREKALAVIENTPGLHDVEVAKRANVSRRTAERARKQLAKASKSTVERARKTTHAPEGTS